MLEMKDILQGFLEGISKDIKAEQSKQGRVASGKTAQSLESESTDTTGILYGNISVNVLETGRKGGRGPYGFREIILQWMDDKGIFKDESESKRKSIAYLISEKIKKEGTNLYRSGGNSGVLSSVITDDRLRQFERAVLTKFGREFTEEALTTFGYD